MATLELGQRAQWKKTKHIKQKGSQRGFVTHTVYSAKSTGWHGQRLLKEQLTQKLKVSHYLLHPNTWKVSSSVVDYEKHFPFPLPCAIWAWRSQFYFYFLFWNESSSTSVIWENAANVLRITKLHLTFHLREGEENILNFRWAFPLKEKC